MYVKIIIIILKEFRYKSYDIDYSVIIVFWFYFFSIEGFFF